MLYDADMAELASTLLDSPMMNDKLKCPRLKTFYTTSK